MLLIDEQLVPPGVSVRAHEFDKLNFKITANYAVHTYTVHHFVMS